jgi:hypothetical protein
MKIGQIIRRKLSKKQKNIVNNHPIFKIIKFYKTPEDPVGMYLEMVELEDSNGKKSYMQEAGLEWYEGVK